MAYEDENPTDPRLAIRDILCGVKSMVGDYAGYVDLALTAIKNQTLTEENIMVVSATAVLLLQRTRVDDVELISHLVQILRFTLQLEQIEAQTTEPKA